MDRDEAHRLLKSGSQGVKKWNTWRRQNPLELPPNLSGTYFHEADLCVADLHDADLHATDFSGANLRWANLQNAYLYNADFRVADLSESNLSRANLRSANVQKANLSGADLTGADFDEANLCEVDFSRALLRRTRFSHTPLRDANFRDASASAIIWASVDLSQARGLDQLEHFYSSTLGIDTLFMSGQLTDEFLLDSGVPETILEYVKASPQSVQPIQYHSCLYQL